MKQVTKSLVIVGAMLAAGSAAADMMDLEFKPFVGVDFVQAWTPAKGNISPVRNENISAKSAFKNSFPGMTVYVGSKFTECLGIELGWDSSVSAKKKTAVSPSNTAIAGGYKYTTKIRREGMHADLVGFLPMDCWELFGSLGIGSVKMKLSGQDLTANTAASQAALNAASQTPFSSKRKAVLRAGLGANYMFTEMFGARVKVGYENTSALRLKYTNGTSVKAFKDTTSLALGLFARF